MTLPPSDFSDIEFDEGNESELAGHHVSPSEVWEVLVGEPTWVPNKKGRAGTWLVVGFTTGGRCLSIPVVYDAARDSVRPITGWTSTVGERDRYT